LIGKLASASGLDGRGDGTLVPTMDERAIAPELIETVLELAAARGVPVAEVTVAEIARAVGVSRMTLYRRIGSRAALHQAIRAAGVDPGDRPSVRTRAVDAAAAIIREGGIAALTLEAVAERAACSLPALHSQLGGRQGLLMALFERYSPLPEVEHVLNPAPDSLEEGVRSIYRAIYDAAMAEPALVRALIGEELRAPQSEIGQFLTTWYLPRVFGTAGAWLSGQVERGNVRLLPLPILLQLLAGPFGLHVLTHQFLTRDLGYELPPRAEAIALFAAAYCRAVGLPDEACDDDSRRG
jgi:AcrR family transcriptional regulator